jgi:hypothetical protein
VTFNSNPDGGGHEADGDGDGDAEKPDGPRTDPPLAAMSAPSGFRTPDPLIKSQLLYQLS